MNCTKPLLFGPRIFHLVNKIPVDKDLVPVRIILANRAHEEQMKTVTIDQNVKSFNDFLISSTMGDLKVHVFDTDKENTWYSTIFDMNGSS